MSPRPDEIADIQQAHVAMMHIDAAEKQGGAWLMGDVEYMLMRGVRNLRTGCFQVRPDSLAQGDWKSLLRRCAMTKVCELDCWLARLYGHTTVDSAAVLERDWAEANPRADDPEEGPVLTVQIIEVVNDRMIIVAWQDPTGGRYGYQTWTRVLARRDAVCALTGLSVKRGDAVFHPKNFSDRRPANADSVILAGEVKRNLSAATDANHPA